MAAITTASIGVLGAGYQAYQGSQDAKSAKNAINNYKRQELNNAAEGMQVSTLGADRQREDQSRLASTQISALQGAGARGLVGGLGRVEAAGQAVSQSIAANLDSQQKDIDQLRYQDEQNIRTMRETREQQDLAALSSQYNAGKQQMWDGIGGMAQAGMSGAAALGGGVGTPGNAKGAAGFNPGKTNFDSSLNFKPTTTYFR